MQKPFLKNAIIDNARKIIKKYQNPNVEKIVFILQQSVGNSHFSMWKKVSKHFVSGLGMSGKK